MMVAPTQRAVRFALLALLCLAPHAHAAWPHDPYTGNVLACGATGHQYAPRSVPDGAGGVILAWYDLRAGNYDIYAQRISAAGVPLWGANGLAVCVEASNQLEPTIAPDGLGGAVIGWTDYRNLVATGADVYAQRVNASGTALWAANGVPVCTVNLDQSHPQVVGDGAGGAVAAWYDLRSGTGDVYAQKLGTTGTRLWLLTGVALCVATNHQGEASLRAVPDGAGGAIAAWDDFRSGTNFDIYAQRVLSGGTTSWTANGVVLCDAADAQSDVELIADGAGGAIAAWDDQRSGTNTDVYAQRVVSNGAMAWATDGVLVSDATANQRATVLAGDGFGGAIIAWEDERGGSASDIYAQRVVAGGSALWTANGVALCTSVSYQTNLSIAPDGSGGAIAAWQDYRGGSTTDTYAQRVSGAGAAQWSSNGALVCGAPSNTFNASVSSDGAGGAIVAWQDARALSHYDLYAQRIERFGQLGNPEPAITGVKDVKNDQGGFVKVSWNASWLDVDPVYGVFDYRLWRSVPASLAAQAAFSRSFSSDPDEAAASGRFLVLPSSAQAYAWELVGTQTAAILGSYSLVAATTADSIPGSFPRTAFMVEARAGTSLGADRWYSAPDSGYSVDNLAPAAPAPLTGQYAAGSTALHWNRNTEADLAGYRLYRGSSAAFAPSPANLVASPTDTGYVDAAGAPYVYKLTAVDAHGNESPVATLIPTGALDVPGDPPAARAFFELAGANPSRGASTLRFGLASPGRAALSVYDAGGRRVRTLASGAFEAGEHAVAWDGRDEAGHPVAAGLYFARIEGPGLSATRRIVRTE